MVAVEDDWVRLAAVHARVGKQILPQAVQPETAAIPQKPGISANIRIAIQAVVLTAIDREAFDANEVTSASSLIAHVKLFAGFDAATPAAHAKAAIDHLLRKRHRRHSAANARPLEGQPLRANSSGGNARRGPWQVAQLRPRELGGSAAAVAVGASHMAGLDFREDSFPAIGLMHEPIDNLSLASGIVVVEVENDWISEPAVHARMVQ